MVHPVRVVFPTAGVEPRRWRKPVGQGGEFLSGVLRVDPCHFAHRGEIAIGKVIRAVWT